MYITEEQLVEAYGKGNPHERFNMIYKNYEVFQQQVDSFEVGLFNRIMYEVEYNRRAKNGEDLGIRINTGRVSSPTESKAIEHLEIREAIEEGNFSGKILEDTDTPEKHKHDILTIHMMRREFEVFDSCLKALPKKEFRINYSYLHDKRKMAQIAEEEDRAYQTICNVISSTKKILEGRTVPFFKESI